MFSDNKNFYPTPYELYRKLLNDVRYLSGRILEPSAGKGDLVEYMKKHNNGRSNDDLKIDAIEIDQELVSMLMGKGVDVVWNDFLTYETFKEYDYIVMNPPFSNGVDHLLKAIRLAENQITHCEIYAVLNKETINNAHTTKRQELMSKLHHHGAKIEYVKDAFVHAERKTTVEVALIRISIKKRNLGKSLYDSIQFNGIQKSREEVGAALSLYMGSTKVSEKLDEIERLVIEYETACKLAKDTYEAIHAKQSFYDYIAKTNRKEGISSTSLDVIATYKKIFHVEDLNEELDRLRRGYWELILNTDDFRKILTNEAIQKLNRQMQTVNSMEINLTNIKLLLLALSTNKTDILIESVVSIFQKITERHMTSYSTNIHYYNGWKSNSAYKLNKKIIVPIQYSSFNSWDFSEEYNRISFSVRNWIDDIVKCLKLIDPDVNNSFQCISLGEFENDWIRFKMFRKGTLHVWFKDTKLLARLNYICGIHFNWIPGEDEQNRDPKAREWVAKEFGNIGEVKLIWGAA